MGAQEDLLLRAQAIIRDLREKLAAAARPAKEEIAIVGMACRFPGEAVDVDSFWAMSVAGRTSAIEVPATRWVSKERSEKGPQQANLVVDLLGFDAAFFDISPREALQMDPAQRMFLEVAWHALENAGLPREKLAGSATGVFVGHTGFSDFLVNRLAEGGETDSFTATGNSPDVLAGRLSFLLDLHGPCAAINTGCSSSLVALHMGRRSLLANDCRIAVVGGVNVVGPLAFELAEDLSFFAPDGQCKPFDARANGFGRGDGCGVIVMKRLSDAVADHDHIWSVLRGSAINQDGRTNGLTAPNGLAQTEVVRQALKDAGLTASQIGYVETHGTGTVIGDPIEVEALSAAFSSANSFGSASDHETRCALGTAKANIGHLEGAAGIAGVIRAVCAMRHKTIPPLAGFESLNPHVKLEGSPFYIPTAALPWHQASNGRYAGVSSFGWSGTNGHVVLAEAPVSERHAWDPTATEFLVPVSSATPHGLRAMLHAMAEAFEGCDDRDLGALAWSAGARRTHHAYRAAVVGGTGKEIAEALRRKASQEPAQTQQSSKGGLENSRRPTKRMQQVDSPANSHLSLVGASFEAGGEVQWDELPGIERRMIPLPAYRFHREAIGCAKDEVRAIGPDKHPRVDEWFYEVAWREQPLPFEEHREPVSAVGTETDWLLFADNVRLAEEFAHLVVERGGTVTLVRSGGQFEQTDRNLFAADPKDPHQVAQVLNAIHCASSGPLKIVFFGALASAAEEDPVQRSIDLLAQISGICKALGTRRGIDAQLWLITRGAQRVDHESSIGSPLQAALWGLNAVALLEQTPHWRGIVDLAPKPSQIDATLLLQECMADGGEQRIAYRRGRRFVARFMPATAPVPKQVRFPADAVYMITGPFGGIGLELAGWLIDRGAKHLVLVARTALPERGDEGEATTGQRRALQAIRRWRDAGVDITVAAADVADRDSMSRIFSNIGADGFALRGVFHAAAELVWKPLVEQTETEIARSFHAKVRGALVLDELTRDLPLDFFVFFSSMAASVGALGAASYAAANAFVDALVDERSSQGRNFQSVQWGYWERHDVKNDAAEDQFRRSGFSAMPAASALSALGRVMRSGAVRAIVADIDLERFRTALNLRGASRFLEASRQAPVQGQLAETALMNSLRPLDHHARIEAIRLWISREIRALCGWPSHYAVDEDRGFFDMGMTSLTSLELRRSLVAALGCKLPGTATLLYPNVNALADFVHGELFGRPADADGSPTSSATDTDLENLTDEQTRSALREELELLRGAG